MEKFGNVHTAQDLYKFLSEIPESQRERLPIVFINEKSEDDGTVDVAAYEFENGGNIERGFHIEGYHK